MHEKDLTDEFTDALARRFAADFERMIIAPALFSPSMRYVLRNSSLRDEPTTCAPAPPLTVKVPQRNAAPGPPARAQAPRRAISFEDV